MAATTKTVLTFLLACCAAPAAVLLTPEQASLRQPPNYAPAHLGERAAIQGTVSSRPVQMLGQYWHAGLEQNGQGIMLESPVRDPKIAALNPGDRIEASGVIEMRGGLPVLRVEAFRLLSRGPAPEPVYVPVDDLQSFRYLGRLVFTEGVVVEVGENTGGAYMLIGSEGRPYKIFLPNSPSTPRPSFAHYVNGDRVRVTGLASQYCHTAPYDRWFQITMFDARHSTLVQRRWVVNPAVLFGSLLAAALFGLLLWSRERRLRSQRETLRRAYQLGEEILGSASTEAIQNRVARVLPRIFGISEAHLYVHNLGARALDEVPGRPEDGAVSIPLNGAATGIQAAAAACFHNGALLAIPDTSRSPFPAENSGKTPRSVLFVPMLAQGEPVGVLQMDRHDRVHDFSRDEQALAQHLANQIGATLKLLEQRMVREQLFRTEKLAAVGRLISGVISELRAPLSSICQRAEAVVSDPRVLADPQLREREAQSIYAEARKATQIVSRLVSFATTEEVEARTVDLNAVIRSMAEFREREWASRGIRTHAVVSEEPLTVTGSQGQLEQVILDLLVYAEHALANAAEKIITLRTSRLGRKALVEISYTGPHGVDPFAGLDEVSALGLGVCRSIVAGHGGDLRAVQAEPADPRFEIELPLAWRGRAEGLEAPSRPGQSFTALVIEPDEPSQRQLLNMLTSRNCRVIPVQNSDVGLEMAQRIHFDAAFCSFHAPGLNWVELSEELQSRVGGFVLLTDGYDRELAADFEGDGRYVLPKPLDDAQLDRVLSGLERTLKPA